MRPQNSRLSGREYSDKPKAGVSGRPFQLMLLAQVKCETVTPGEDLITDVAFIFGHPLNLLEHKASIQLINSYRIVQMCYRGDVVSVG